jgi:hypothetical protein
MQGSKGVSLLFGRRVAGERAIVPLFIRDEPLSVRSGGEASWQESGQDA